METLSALNFQLRLPPLLKFNNEIFVTQKSTSTKNHCTFIRLVFSTRFVFYRLAFYGFSWCTISFGSNFKNSFTPIFYMRPIYYFYFQSLSNPPSAKFMIFYLLIELHLSRPTLVPPLITRVCSQFTRNLPFQDRYTLLFSS